MNYLIIGNGVAGMEAANAIRKNDPEGSIRIVSASRHPHYYRPRVIEYLADEVPVEKLFVYKKDHYEKNRIENILDTEIERIDVDGKAAIDTGGKRHPYDRLLMATGAHSFIPPLKGAELEGVFTLRGISDADRIKRHCAGVSRVAVIGGGLLGLEAAHSLCKLGKKVTVIEFCRWLLPRQLDMQGGAILMKMLEEKGLSFVLDDSVLSIEGNGKVEKVSLKSGVEIAAGAVLVSAGIRCRLDLARKSGITVNTGIIVDDYMATSADGIYAAGDSVEHRGVLYGIWPAAREQGRVAGSNMAGVPEAYTGSILANTLKITGIDLFSAGRFEATDCEVYVSEHTDNYKKLLINYNNPVGAIVLGDAEAVKLAQKVIDGRASAEELKKLF